MREAFLCEHAHANASTRCSLCWSWEYTETLWAARFRVLSRNKSLLPGGSRGIDNEALNQMSIQRKPRNQQDLYCFRQNENLKSELSVSRSPSGYDSPLRFFFYMHRDVDRVVKHGGSVSTQEHNSDMFLVVKPTPGSSGNHNLSVLGGYEAFRRPVPTLSDFSLYLT